MTSASIKECVRPVNEIIKLQARVVTGFGRGGKQLGCPTANMCAEDLGQLVDDFEPGIYCGWAMIKDQGPYKAVASIGWNPFYKNKEKTVEPHLLHTFEEDFYDQPLKFVICGYLRPEKDFPSLEALIEAIQLDIRLSDEALDQPPYQSFNIITIIHPFQYSTRLVFLLRPNSQRLGSETNVILILSFTGFLCATWVAYGFRDVQMDTGCFKPDNERIRASNVKTIRSKLDVASELLVLVFLIILLWVSDEKPEIYTHDEHENKSSRWRPDPSITSCTAEFDDDEMPSLEDNEEEQEHARMLHCANKEMDDLLLSEETYRSYLPQYPEEWMVYDPIFGLIKQTELDNQRIKQEEIRPAEDYLSKVRLKANLRQGKRKKTNNKRKSKKQRRKKRHKH